MLVEVHLGSVIMLQIEVLGSEGVCKEMGEFFLAAMQCTENLSLYCVTYSEQCAFYSAQYCIE